ncbi:hypothetical protein AND_002553 [Anopheles darlingi]|uniref:Uncharacterized protein n=1 Tax=Anopheles darlingi TaxID=43151 RepID=W5JQU1_ANODA|nr:hypothetical protein AND_002553 [Anopheles darlingi]
MALNWTVLLSPTALSSLWAAPLPKAVLLLSPTTWIVLLAVAISSIAFYVRRAELVKHIDRIPGPAALPLLGNSLQWLVDRDGKQNSTENPPFNH